MVGPAHASAFVRCAALATAITGMQALVPSSAAAKILLFEDVTNTSGIDLRGVTHSVLWGDFNNDGCPDLWISKHSGDDGQAANLYQNLCNGRFRDVTKATVGDLRGYLDFHGAAWADFDNDGDADLMQLRGGGEGVGVGPNLRARLFVNSGGRLVDRAAKFGVDYLWHGAECRSGWTTTTMENSTCSSGPITALTENRRRRYFTKTIVCSRTRA